MHSTTASSSSMYRYTQSNTTTLNDGVNNGSMVYASNPLIFDAAGLLREQKEFLEQAQASEIRASLFLRLRLSAQQKLTVQRNQLAERRSMQKDFDSYSSNAVPHSASARTTAPIRNTEAFISNTAAEEHQGNGQHVLLDVDAREEKEQEKEEQHCPGCARRYTDMLAFSRHKGHCKAYAVLLRKASTKTGSISHVAISSDSTGVKGHSIPTFIEELQAVQQRLNTISNSTSINTNTGPGTAINRGGGVVSSVLNTSAVSPPPSTASQHMGTVTYLMPEFRTSGGEIHRRGVGGNTGVVPTLLSLRTESQSTNYSLSIRCSTPQEERTDDRDERDGRREEKGFCFSREPTPSSPGVHSQQRLPVTGVLNLDDVPAAVTARPSADLKATSTSMTMTSLTDRERDEVDGFGVKSQQLLSCRQSSVTMMSNNGSIANLKMEPEGVDEPLKPCPHCGRQFFAISRWPRHVAVCEQRQQQQQRKSLKGTGTGTAQRVYDARAHRLSQIYAGENITPISVSQDSKEPLISSRGKAGSALASTRNSKSTNTEKKTSKWRKQRAQLRQALQLNSGRSHDTNKNDDSDGDLFEDDRVSCPSCGRRFAAATAERHIPFCKQRQKGGTTMRM
ncbi:hypothetical protein LSM04_002482 [Trypanosoma melophagium]|uniref:uncharacterized protein n=1 Tax=Trypanosoma melophagium TaxID=715481 RepID=UPI00351A58F3|nr:hypothetical protein LSM04_002482 [Trypanosoma melophagium]